MPDPTTTDNLPPSDFLRQALGQQPTPTPPPAAAKEEKAADVVEAIANAVDPAATAKTPEVAVKPDAVPEAPAKKDHIDALLDGGSNQALEVSDDLKGFFSKNFGSDDVPTVVKEHGTLKERATALETELDEAKRSLDGFEKLPLRLRNTVAKALSGENWEEYIRSAADFDYAKEGRKQDRRSLVDHYFPGVVADETWTAIKAGDADEADKASVEKLGTRASAMFDHDRTAHLDMISKMDSQTKARQGALLTSIDQGFAHARKNNPELAVLLTPELRKGMADYSKIFGLFVDKDSNYLPDAVRKITLVENIDDVLARMRQRMQVEESRKAVLQATEKLPENARVMGSTPATPPAAVPKIQEEINQLTGRNQPQPQRTRF